MQVSEILRALADTLSSIANDEQPETGNTEMHLAQTQAANVDNAEKAEAAKDELGEFVPPLQQKIELLKKAVDVDSYFDEEEPDELTAIKRNAGLNPNAAAIISLSDDEPLDE